MSKTQPLGYDIAMSNNSDPTQLPDSGNEQDASGERQPLPCAVSSYVVTLDQPVPAEVQDELAAFLRHEKELTDAPSLPEDVARSRSDAQYNHVKSWGYFERRLGKDPAPAMSQHEDDGGVLLVARDPVTNRMIGFSSVVIQSLRTTPVPKTTYTGVGLEYTGRGVGGALFLIKALCIANLGVPAMDVSVWEASQAMIQKAGIEAEVIPPVVYPGMATSANPQLRIPLDPAALAQLCQEKLGFTPDPNTFTGTCQFVLEPPENADAGTAEQ